jgi:hypothetical protein
MEGTAPMTISSTHTPRSAPIDIQVLGWALTITFLLLYLLCWAAALAVPDLPLAHGWILLFSTADPGSARSLIEGVVGSVAFAWISALAFGWAYNRLSRR